MKTLLVGVFVLLACHIGQTLDCYSCDYGTCLFPSKITCSGLDVCVTETSSLTQYLSLKKKSCGPLTICDTETTNTQAGIKVTTKASCCITSLCNSAVTSRVSLLTGICALVALWLAKLS